MPVVSVTSRLAGWVTGSVDGIGGGDSPSWKHCPPEMPHFEYEACVGEWALGVGCCSSDRSRLAQAPSRVLLQGCCVVAAAAWRPWEPGDSKE